MSTDINMALDDIISKTRTGRRGRGRAAAGGGRGVARGGGRGRAGMRRGAGGGRSAGGVGAFTRSGRVPAGRWDHDLYGGTGFASGGRRSGGEGVAKLNVSNLDYGVTDSDMKELFGEFGPTRRATVHFDRSGRSLGEATVIFERRNDAVRAMRQYNGVALDGRPMKINLDGAEAAAPTAARIGGIRGRMPARGRGVTRGRAGARGGGRGRGGGGGGRGAKTAAPTMEELDAELDAYICKCNKK